MALLHFVYFIIALLLFYILGYLTKNYLTKKDVTLGEGLGTIEGSMLALFAFFLGFTFSISANKIETVRETSINESNAIGTALLRTQMYEDSIQKKFTILFKDYLQSRINYFSPSNNVSDNTKFLHHSIQKSNEIWEYAVQLEKSKNYIEESRLLLPSINEMIDAITSRDSAINAKLPNAIIYTLYILSILSCFIVGFSMKKNLVTHIIGFIYIIIIALTVNLIIDAANPRGGFINTTKANETLKEMYQQL